MKQRGILKLEGSIGDITFYKSMDGYLARTKGVVSKDRINSDPKFARTRENVYEFGLAANAGKFLRDTVKTLMKNAKDARVTSRLLATMSRIQKLDNHSARGSRNVGAAIADPAAKAMLKGFEFSSNSKMSAVLFKPYSVDLPTGKIVINGLIPMNDVKSPDGATHLSLRGAFANVNLATGASSIVYTNMLNLPIDSASTTVSLAPAAVPAGTGTKLYLLQIEFSQMVNGVQYALSNGAFNALVIAEIG